MRDRLQKTRRYYNIRYRTYQACITAGSLTQYTSTSSTPAALRSSKDSRCVECKLIKNLFLFYIKPAILQPVPREGENNRIVRTLSLNVTGDLDTGSGGSKGSGESYNDNILSLDVVSNIEGFRVREASFKHRG